MSHPAVVRRVLAACACVFLGAASLRAAPPDKDVVVTNTPAQPVPTTVQGNVLVRVVNPVTAPVPVKNTADPAFQPFADLKAIDFADGEAQKDIFFDPVPAGRRLVIETVTVRAQASLPQIWEVDLMPVTNGAPSGHFLALGAPDDAGGIGIRTATLPVRLYADAGTQTRLFAHRQNGDSGQAIVLVTLSGYFVTLP